MKNKKISDIKRLNEMNKAFDPNKNVRFIFLGEPIKIKNGKATTTAKVLDTTFSYAAKILKNL